MESQQKSLKNLTGLRFGKLTVTGRSETNSKSGNARWACQCECGGNATVIGSHLRSGKTSSCGCLRTSEIAQGHSHERIYRTWNGMHKRCYNPKHDKYKWYGAKGISVCLEWHDFITFREWALSNGYTDELTIDRKNPFQNYSPDNCQFVDMKFQANNKTNNKIVAYKNVEYTAAQFAEKLNVPYYTVRNQLRAGWSIEKIVKRAKGA